MKRKKTVAIIGGAILALAFGIQQAIKKEEKREVKEIAKRELVVRRDGGVSIDGKVVSPAKIRQEIKKHKKRKLTLEETREKIEAKMKALFYTNEKVPPKKIRDKEKWKERKNLEIKDENEEYERIVKGVELIATFSPEEMKAFYDFLGLGSIGTIKGRIAGSPTLQRIQAKFQAIGFDIGEPSFRVHHFFNGAKMEGPSENYLENLLREVRRGGLDIYIREGERMKRLTLRDRRIIAEIIALINSDVHLREMFAQELVNLQALDSMLEWYLLEIEEQISFMYGLLGRIEDL